MMVYTLDNVAPGERFFFEWDCDKHPHIVIRRLPNGDRGQKYTETAVICLTDADAFYADNSEEIGYL